jgi:hypothetical protein
MTEIKTGLDVIRATLHARARAGHLGPIARDIGAAVADLEDFAYGHRDLPAAALQALVRDLFHGQAEYDATLNLMRPVNRTEAKPLGVAPPRFDASQQPKFIAGPRMGPQPVTPQKPQAKTKRAGWLHGWL